MDIKEFRELRQIGTNRNKAIAAEIDSGLSRINKLIKFAENTPEYLAELDRQFEEKTSLNSHEFLIMLTVIGLQLLRQHLLTRFQDRVDDQTAAKDCGKDKEHSNRHHRYYNPSMEEIMQNPVPYDANLGADGRLSGGGSLGHRTKTLGHDPLLGLIFGTANIATSTLTTNEFASYHIKTCGKRDVFAEHASTALVLQYTAQKMLEGVEGRKKVGCSFIKEIRHLRSDIYSINGLPLPVISSIDPKFASKLAEYGFDFGNVLTMSKQLVYAKMINSFAAMYHYCFYDGSIPEKLYKVKTKKIICYANVIASGINIAEVAVTKNQKILDIGGIANTIYEIITSVKFIRKVKRDFIFGTYDAALDAL